MVEDQFYLDKLESVENVIHGAVNKIDPDQIPEKRLDKYFECMLCLMVVDRPVQCIHCSKLFCKDCMDDSLTRKSECCHCG